MATVPKGVRNALKAKRIRRYEGRQYVFVGNVKVPSRLQRQPAIKRVRTRVKSLFPGVKSIRLGKRREGPTPATQAYPAFIRADDATARQIVRMGG